MPEAPQMPAQPGQPPAAGGQAPFGQSSAMGPTPNRGAEAQAMQKLAMAVKLVGDALGAAGATSELGQEILKFLPKLSKLVAPGASTPASEKNGIDQMAMKNAQQNQAMQQMRQKMMQGGGGGQQPPQGQPGMQAAA